VEIEFWKHNGFVALEERVNKTQLKGKVSEGEEDADKKKVGCTLGVIEGVQNSQKTRATKGVKSTRKPSMKKADHSDEEGSNLSTLDKDEDLDDINTSSSNDDTEE